MFFMHFNSSTQNRTCNSIDNRWRIRYQNKLPIKHAPHPECCNKNTLIKREFAYYLIGFHSEYYFNTKEHSSSYTVRCEF